MLTEYKWPGNVRELQNVIQRAVILCDSDTLVVDETWLQNRRAKETTGSRGLGRPALSIISFSSRIGFVEEDRAAVGELEPAEVPLDRAGERAFLTAIHRYERP